MGSIRSVSAPFMPYQGTIGRQQRAIMPRFGTASGSDENDLIPALTLNPGDDALREKLQPLKKFLTSGLGKLLGPRLIHWISTTPIQFKRLEWLFNIQVDYYTPEVSQNNGIQPITIDSLDGTPLRAYWITPRPGRDKDEKPSTVVMGHGYTADWGILYAVANKLREDGHKVLVFNFRTHGGSSGNKTSIGYNEALDVGAVVQYADNHHPDDNLFYYGHSMGAVALMMAPEKLARQDHEHYRQALACMETKLDGLILDAPYKGLKDEYSAFLQRYFGNDDAARGFIKRFIAFVDKRNYYPLPLAEMDSVQLLLKSPALAQKPILHYHGTKDATTPYAEGQEIVTNLEQAGCQVTAVALEGADHSNHHWSPEHTDSDATYYSILRGEPTYMDAFLSFVNDTPS